MFQHCFAESERLPMQKSHPLSPERMSSEQRLDEVAKILANGLFRLRDADQSPTPASDSDSDVSLAITAYRSVHGHPETAEKTLPKEA
jgi:hypothetical protein